jgi:hypothetical protein
MAKIVRNTRKNATRWLYLGNTCLVRMSHGPVAIPTGFYWCSPVPSNKYQFSTWYMPRPLPFTSFLIDRLSHHPTLCSLNTENLIKYPINNNYSNNTRKTILDFAYCNYLCSNIYGVLSDTNEH